MSLRKYRIPTETVEFPGGDPIPVRGLALSDITVLTRKHMAVFAALFAKINLDSPSHTPELVSDSASTPTLPEAFAGAAAAAKAPPPSGKADDGFMALFGETLLVSAPDLAGDVIALGANLHRPGHLDPEDADIARTFPVTVQVAALERIGRLTFQSEIAIRNLIETVIKVASGTTALVTGKTT